LGPKQYVRVIYPSIENFTWSKKKYTFGGQKGENKPLEPKNGIWGPYARVTYPLIGNFTWSKKKYTFRAQKGENKALKSTSYLRFLACFFSFESDKDFFSMHFLKCLLVFIFIFDILGLKFRF
jgi:hypothetical protein